MCLLTFILGLRCLVVVVMFLLIDLRHYCRYNVSKLMLIFACRELAAHVSQSTKPGNIIVSIVNPGSVAKSESEREHGGIAFRLTRKALMRKTEEGSRTLVYAAGGGRETHGQYLDDCKVSPCVILTKMCEHIQDS